MSLVTIILASSNALASEISFNVVSDTTFHDGATVIEVRIDPQGDSINVVEGILGIQNVGNAKISSVAIDTGGSVLTLWPFKPEYDENKHLITFTGGAPRGFNHEGLLFRVRIFSSASGSVRLSSLSTTSYLNDGAGSIKSVDSKSISVAVSKSDQSASSQVVSLSSDTKPPVFSDVEVGRDESVYDGKSFVSFRATDDGLGVVRYEVKEGETVTEVSDGVYVFKDQGRDTKVTITAYDAAGNSKTVTVTSLRDRIINVIVIILIAIITVTIFWYGYKKFLKK